MTRVAIVGSAGRKEDKKLVTFRLYLAALEAVLAQLDKWEIPLDDTTTLVSGGAAFMDHLSVSAYYKTSSKLELHYPCKWDKRSRQFVDTGHRDYRVNPGKTANYYHQEFSRSLGFEASPNIPTQSLQTLHELVSYPEHLKSVKILDHYQGFHDRNLAVGNVDYLIALTRGTGNQPVPGGTAHTWEHSRAAHKAHISLTNLWTQLCSPSPPPR